MTGFNALDRFVLEKISETKLPGISLATVKEGAVVYSRGMASET